jgi:hypothetical protein
MFQIEFSHVEANFLPGSSGASRKVVHDFHDTDLARVATLTKHSFFTTGTHRPVAF